MSWSSMSAELQGQCPIPPGLGTILVNRAWKDVQREWFWSFRWLDFSIATPAATTAGTVTLTAGLTTVVGDAAAVAVWNAIPLITPITSQQFRIGQGTIYNINAYDSVNTLTLDRAFVDAPFGAGIKYQIYQIYYPAPVSNFVWFDDIRDPVTGYSLSTTKTRAEAGYEDPQRLQLGFPVAAIPYQIIQNQSSSFYGFPSFELWPAPQQSLVYTASAYLSDKGFDNTSPGFSDTVLYPLDEDVVMELAKQKAYEWCIVNPDKCPKGDYRYAHGECKVEYKRMINRFIAKDEEFSKRNTIPSAERSGYGPSLPWVSMSKNIGEFPS